MTSPRISLLLALVAPVAVLSACSSSSNNNATQMQATLDAHQVVTAANQPWTPPAAVADAKGSLTGSLDPHTGKLTWTLTYSGIGTPILAIADIHRGERGQF